MEKILKIKNISVEFAIEGYKLRAVNDVSLFVNKNEIVGLVGESGSGKTLTALSILNMIPYPGKIIKGEIIFGSENNNLLDYSEKEMDKIRGNKISIIFQNPLTSLNPCFRIGWQLIEVLKKIYVNLSKEEYNKIIKNNLKKVYLKNVDDIVNQFPHQLSGGMRQRVIIAMAISLNPSLIIADEATTALDVTTQDEIFNLFEEIRCKNSISFIVISHNLDLIGERTERIYVMYAGQIVEVGSAKDINQNPIHPYTVGLIKSNPGIYNVPKKLYSIKGEVPDLRNLPKKGCYFINRCEFSKEICSERMPELKIVSPGRSVRCHMVGK